MSDDKEPYLTSDDVQEILRILERSTFNALDLEIGDVRLRLRRGAGADTSVAAWQDTPAPRAAATHNGASEDARPAPVAAAPIVPGTVEIRAPMLGTFYRAPRPGAAPFVDIGGAVTPQTTVGIIEVMKLMNGVLAGAEGEICEVCVEDGALVEYDQVLMRMARAPTAS